MDYKEKYEQALERAKKVHTTNVDENKKSTEYIFPELRESENEKIRKGIIKYLEQSQFGEEHYCIDDDIVRYYIDWLEKQGEHQEFLNKIQIGDELTKNERGQLVNLSQLKRIAKPRNKVEPKFKAGDIIVNEYGFIMQIDEIDGNMYGYHVLDGNILLKHDITKADKSCHLWTIQDAKDGDVLAASDDSIFIFKEIMGCGCKHYIALAKDNKTINVNDNLKYSWETSSAAHPSTKEQRDLLFQKMKEAGYKWDAEKKELKRITD